MKLAHYMTALETVVSEAKTFLWIPTVPWSSNEDYGKDCIGHKSLYHDEKTRCFPFDGSYLVITQPSLTLGNLQAGSAH